MMNGNGKPTINQIANPIRSMRASFPYCQPATQSSTSTTEQVEKGNNVSFLLLSLARVISADDVVLMKAPNCNYHSLYIYI